MRYLILMLMVLTYGNATLADCGFTNSCGPEVPIAKIIFINHDIVDTECIFDNDGVVLAYETKNSTVVWFKPLEHQVVYSGKNLKCRGNINAMVYRANIKYKQTGQAYIVIKNKDMKPMDVDTEGYENDVATGNSTYVERSIKTFIRHVFIDNFTTHTDDEMLKYIRESNPHKNNLGISKYYYSVKNSLKDHFGINNQNKHVTKQPNGYRQQVGKVIVETLFGTGKQSKGSKYPPPMGSIYDYPDKETYQRELTKRMLEGWSPLGGFK